MNSEVEMAQRRLTVIVDPHIKASKQYEVYKEGQDL
jgi:hypothetical protein